MLSVDVGVGYLHTYMGDRQGIHVRLVFWPKPGWMRLRWVADAIPRE